MKTVMNQPRTDYQSGKINNKFQQFADDYGFKIRPCIAGRPNTKAKVEAPMKLLDEIGAYNGTLNFDELHELISKLNNRINGTYHTSIGKIPVLHLEKEKDFLLDLPTQQIRNRYSIITTSVKVNRQSMIFYKSNQYSVPPEYINKKLKLQVYDNHYLQISSLTFKNSKYEMNEIAKNNLKMIGEIYGD